MFEYLKQKILNNKKMMGALLLGIVLLLMLSCSIPIFSNVVFEKALINDLNKNEREGLANAGIVSSRFTFNFTSSKDDNYNAYNSITAGSEKFFNSFPIPQEMLSREVDAGPVVVQKQALDIKGFKFIPFDVDVTKGVMMSDKVVDGVVEGMMEESIAATYPQIVLGQVYELRDSSEKVIGKIKIAGIFKTKTVVDDAPKTTKELAKGIESTGLQANQDVQWIYASEKELFGTSIIVSDSVLTKDFIDPKVLSITRVNYRALYDYKSMNLVNVDNAINSFDDYSNWAKDITSDRSVVSEFIGYDILKQYVAKQNQMQIILWIIQIPIFIMLLF
jgi:putative ABC transport system permease protein